MFIELTDHLRCPADHEEAFLVLLPDQMADRSVMRGQLGCPLCGRVFPVERGELDVGGAPDYPAEGGALDAGAIVALAGLAGPGGYLVLVGTAAGVWREVADAVAGVGLVAVNPLPGVGDTPGLSVLRGGSIPLKANSMRGVVLGRGYGSDPRWIREAARVTLPGLRVVGEGPAPDPEVIELLASAGGAWVGAKAPVRFRGSAGSPGSG